MTLINPRNDATPRTGRISLAGETKRKVLETRFRGK